MSKPVSHFSHIVGGQRAVRIFKPKQPVNISHSAVGKNSSLGLLKLHGPHHVPHHPFGAGPLPRPIVIPSFLHPLPHQHPWGQPGPVASQNQPAQPDQQQDYGDATQDDTAQPAAQDDTAQAQQDDGSQVQQDDSTQAQQDDTAQTEAQPADAVQEQPAQETEQYAQAPRAQPRRTATLRHRPAVERAQTMHGKPRQNTEETAKATDDEARQAMQEEPEQTVEEDPGQNAQEQGEMAGQAFGYNEPNAGLYMTEE